jgi:hypothetical protein
MPQKFPGTSNSSPISHVSGSPPSGTISETTAVVCRRADTISSRTRMPRGISCFAISPQPWAFTNVVLQSSESGVAGSRLVTRMGTSSGNRVLRRIACCACSVIAIATRNLAIPRRGTQVGPPACPGSPQSSMLDHENGAGRKSRSRIPVRQRSCHHRAIGPAPSEAVQNHRARNLLAAPNESAGHLIRALVVRCLGHRG